MQSDRINFNTTDWNLAGHQIAYVNDHLLGKQGDLSLNFTPVKQNVQHNKSIPLYLA